MEQIENKTHLAGQKNKQRIELMMDNRTNSEQISRWTIEQVEIRTTTLDKITNREQCSGWTTEQIGEELNSNKKRTDDNRIIQIGSIEISTDYAVYRVREESKDQTMEMSGEYSTDQTVQRSSEQGVHSLDMGEHKIYRTVVILVGLLQNDSNVMNF